MSRNELACGATRRRVLSSCRALLLLVFLLSGESLAGQTPTDARAARLYRLTDLAWMVGSWKGETANGFQVEEVVSAPRAGLMMGMFRVINSEKTLVLEFFSLRETSLGVEMRVRHFGPAMEAWEKEDAIRLDLISLDSTKAVFENPVGTAPKRTILTRLGIDALRSQSVIIDANGTRTSDLTLHRVRKVPD